MQKMTEEMWEEARRKRAAGMSAKDIAEEYGMSVNHVRLMTRQTGQSLVDWGTAQALRDAGWAMSDIASHLAERFGRYVSDQEVLEHTRPPKPRKHYVSEWNAATMPILRHNELI